MRDGLDIAQPDTRHPSTLHIVNVPSVLQIAIVFCKSSAQKRVDHEHREPVRLPD